MNRFLLLLPIWAGAIAFLIMYFRKEESVRKVLIVVCLSIVLGGVASFVYADMSNETSNYLPYSFSDIENSDVGKSIQKNNNEKKKEQVQSNKSKWGSDFWNDYMSKKNSK